MEAATLSVKKDPAWVHAFERDGRRVKGAMVPGGVFVVRRGDRFWPGVDGARKAAYLSGELEPALVREASELSGPVTVTVAGHGSVLLTNTGREPLTVGQNFAVVWPTPEDVKAQRECLTMSQTKAAHPELDRQAPLWGSLMATVGRHRTWSSVEAAVRDEITVGEPNGLLFHLGKLQTMAGSSSYSSDFPAQFYESVVNGSPMEPAVTRARVDVGRVAELMKEVGETYRRYSPRVVGVVQNGAQGNGASIPVGGTFYAHVTFVH